MNLNSPDQNRALGRRVESNRALFEFRRSAESNNGFSQALKDLQRSYNSGGLNDLTESQISEIEAYLAASANEGRADAGSALDNMLADLADLRSQKREERLAKEQTRPPEGREKNVQEVDPALARDSNTFDRMKREFNVLFERSKSNDARASKELAAKINGWLEELNFLSDRVQGKDALRKEMEDARRMLNQRGNIEHFFT
ncbi:MAG: hypothetical protein HYY51_02585 [Candidatus Magasanikbacteria bacterium]|nr:hypothetical protein [Candidatus Magasanikbacteria bacterium]